MCLGSHAPLPAPPQLTDTPPTALLPSTTKDKCPTLALKRCDPPGLCRMVQGLPSHGDGWACGGPVEGQHYHPAVSTNACPLTGISALGAPTWLQAQCRAVRDPAVPQRRARAVPSQQGSIPQAVNADTYCKSGCLLPRRKETAQAWAGLWP